MAMSSSILWQNNRKTVVLLDLPRSIEEAQVLSSELAAANGGAKLRRLISSPPLESPFPTPEPKTGGSVPPTAPPSAQVAELMTQAAVESALAEIASSHSGPWCLPRITRRPAPGRRNPSPPQDTRKNITGDTEEPEPSTTNPRPLPEPPPTHHHPTPAQQPPTPNQTPTHDRPLYHLPPGSHPLHGSITTHRRTLLASTPSSSGYFHLILLDPPWPNRSAKRKRTASAAGYRPAADLAALRALLAAVPVASRLAPGGLVAVWVTNAPRCVEVLTGGGGSNGGGGVFAEWGVELVGEWVWLKVTARGEPVVSVGSAWRKPWERLLIARKRGGTSGGGSVEGKVIVSVPDVHSRKPNLRGLFEELLPERYEALEVFARNLTAGWWAWGDEVLTFQRRECWVDAGEAAGE